MMVLCDSRDGIMYTIQSNLNYPFGILNIRHMVDNFPSNYLFQFCISYKNAIQSYVIIFLPVIHECFIYH
ncbi:hypothetical protein C1646_275009 [Rhizophagus diaphanus]|nr:hypothetical protein C1646_275009 [Rhizophagus diaphanus] [Rhizophagus sp. MUCL 43196]